MIVYVTNADGYSAIHHTQSTFISENCVKSLNLYRSCPCVSEVNGISSTHVQNKRTCLGYIIIITSLVSLNM